MLRKLTLFWAQLSGDLLPIIENDDVETLDKIIKKKEDANQRFVYSSPLFYHACAGAKYHCVISLLKLGADPDLFNVSCFNWTPLRFAVQNNKFSLARLLIMHGADLDKPQSDNGFITPRYKAGEAMKTVIAETEPLYKTFVTNKQESEKFKNLGDMAYKESTPNLSGKNNYYQKAIECYKTISNVWKQLQTLEENNILKAYYREQQKVYFEKADQLEQQIVPVLTAKKVNNRDGELRHRKIAALKQQPSGHSSEIPTRSIVNGYTF